MTEHQRGPFYTRRDDALAQERRAKTLALMSTPMRPKAEKPRGHREWMVPLAERRYGA